MSFTNKLIAITALFIGFGSFSAEAKLAVGDQAPEIALHDFASNNLVKLSDYRGKVVYVDFWASWCKPCLQSFPALKTIHNKYQSQGFEILAINVDFKKEKALDFLAKQPVSYVALHDDKMVTSKAYKVNVMPTGFFIDRKGLIRYIHRGFIPGDEKSIDKAVRFLLSEG